MTKLDQLESQLRSSGKWWMYATRTSDISLSDAQKIEIAEEVLGAPKSWAQGLAEEYQSKSQ